ncbi:MAG TPA: tetratricopeptide repeat protein [Blastocatellia bacterium]|nr:tetratricopeptide repeat protein [Blastocatellia bacterium]
MATATSHTCPYKGLQPYTEEDRDYFFGREQDTEIIASNLLIAPLTIFYGASGVGKSSVLQAGVIPRLRKESKVVVVFFNQWQGEAYDAALKAQVFEEVCRRASLSSDEALQKLQTTLEKKKPLRIDTIKLDELLLGCAEGFRLRILLILDQFEEYFLYHAPTTGGSGFEAEFARTVNHEEVGVNFMLSMREEELGKLDRFRQRIPSLLSNLLRLDNLDRDSATEAILKPLGKYNEGRADGEKVEIEPALVTAILDQVKPKSLPDDTDAQPEIISFPRGRAREEAKIETPFLQLVLTRMWEEERGKGSNRLRFSTLERLGGAKNIARTHLDKVMSELAEGERHTAASVLRFLVTPTGTKIAQDPSSLASWAEADSSSVRKVLNDLSSKQDMRILRKVSLPNQEERYELFHDVLGPAILDWRGRFTQEQRLARERRRAKRFGWWLFGAIILLVAMSFLTVYAFQQQREAKRQKAQADEQKSQADEQKKIADDRLVKLQGATDKLQVANTELGKEKEKAEAQKEQALEAKKKEAASRKVAEDQTIIAINAQKAATSREETEKMTRLGLIEHRAGNAEKGNELLRQAAAGYAKLPDPSAQVFALTYIAEVYAAQGGIPSSSAIDSIAGSDDPDEERSLTAEDYRILLGMADSKDKQDAKQDEARERAFHFNEDALDVMNSKGLDEPRNKALILKRMGDICLIRGADKSEAKAKKEAEEELRKSVGYYKQASAAFRRANDPLAEANVLRVAGEFLYSELKEDALEEATGYFEEAREAYNRANNRLKEAVMFSKLGGIYKSLPETYPNGKEKALDYYKRAHDIFAEINRPDLEAPIDSIIARAYEEAGQNNSAFSFYGHGLRAYLKADRLSADGENTNAQDQKPGMIKGIIRVYSNSEEEEQKVDDYFKSVSDDFPADPLEKARLFDVISDSYISELKKEKQDKQRAINYLNQKMLVLQQNNRPVGAIITLFEIGKLYNDLKKGPGVIQSFGDAIQSYKNMTLKQLEENKAQINNELATHFADAGKILIELNEKALAVEAYKEVLELALKPNASYNASSEIDEAYRALGRIYIQQNNTGKAEEVFQKVLSRYPDNPERLSVIGDLYASSRNFMPNALGYYERAISLYETNYKRETSVFYKARHLDAALATMRKIRKLYDDRLNRPGAVSYLTGFSDRARQNQDSVGNAVASEVLGELYSESNDKPRAIKSFEDAHSAYNDLKDKGADARVLKAISNIYRLMGKEEKAKDFADDADKLLNQK